MTQATQRAVALLTAVAVAVATSCTVSTYGYQYRVRQDLGGGEEPESPSAEARELLATATTVAFFPPDICLNTDTQAADKRVQQLRASCGVLLSTLERAAERAGYEVYSWQNLRGGRPIDFARQANVDVLFEINEFDLGSVEDTSTQRTLSFFEKGSNGVDTPLAVSEQLAQRCQAYAAASTPAGADALTGTVDIKTVSVRDGRARWRYRKTLSQSLGRTYPEVTFAAAQTANHGAGVLAGIGLGALIVGAVFVGVGSGGSTGSGSGSNGPDLTPVGDDMLIVGVVALVAGVALQLAVGGTKPSPDQAMCNGTVAPTPGASTLGAPPPVGPMSAEHTFTETTVADPLTKQKEQIRDTMIGQFIGVLKDARGGRPSAPPPTFAPSSPPPQPTPAGQPAPPPPQPAPPPAR